MDENSWRLAQLILWIFGTQTIILMGVLGVIWNKINKLDDKLTKLDEKVNNMDRRLVAVETMLHMKDCCLLKNDGHLKKAE